MLLQLSILLALVEMIPHHKVLALSKHASIQIAILGTFVVNLLADSFVNVEDLGIVGELQE